MRAAAAQAARRVGRRGAVLLVLGIISTLYGASLIADPPPTAQSLRPLFHYAPIPAWGVAWVAAGLCALVCVPLRRDWLAFTGLYLISTPWCLYYLVSWLVGLNPRGWITAALFAAIGGVAAVCAGWNDPPPRVEVRE